MGQIEQSIIEVTASPSSADLQAFLAVPGAWNDGFQGVAMMTNDRQERLQSTKAQMMIMSASYLNLFDREWEK
jgi:hypothetical protein